MSSSVIHLIWPGGFHNSRFSPRAVLWHTLLLPWHHRKYCNAMCSCCLLTSTATHIMHSWNCGWVMKVVENTGVKWCNCQRFRCDFKAVFSFRTQDTVQNSFHKVNKHCLWQYNRSWQQWSRILKLGFGNSTWFPVILLSVGHWHAALCTCVFIHP